MKRESLERLRRAHARRTKGAGGQPWPSSWKQREIYWNPAQEFAKVELAVAPILPAISHGEQRAPQESSNFNDLNW